MQNYEKGAVLDVDALTKIKEKCKTARNVKCMSNADIADAISEKFGIYDFSVNTVNNFFSERSKATTIYTTGYIASVLDVSIDEVFGIEHAISDEKLKEYTDKINSLKVDTLLKNQEIAHLKKACAEKDNRIRQAHNGLHFYRNETNKNSKKIQPWGLFIAVFFLVCSMALNFILILNM